MYFMLQTFNGIDSNDLYFVLVFTHVSAAKMLPLTLR